MTSSVRLPLPHALCGLVERLHSHLHAHRSRCLAENFDPYGESNRMAIISYRCEKSPHDKYTLDPGAFLGAIAAAKSHGIDYVWLDAWAFREQPPWAEYVHKNFCRTLKVVMLAIMLHMVQD